MSSASITKFATMLEPPYETNGQRDPRQRHEPEDAADDDERLQREAEAEPGREELREAVLRDQRDAHDPRATSARKRRSTAAEPMRPSSCAIAE